MSDVFVISYDSGIRKRLVELLESNQHKVISSAFSSPSEAVETVRKNPPDIVVIDHGVITLAILRQVRKAVPGLPSVVILEDENTMFLNNLSTPRIQYLSGNSRYTRLMDAVEYALAGKNTLQRLIERQG